MTRPVNLRLERAGLRHGPYRNLWKPINFDLRTNTL